MARSLPKEVAFTLSIALVIVILPEIIVRSARLPPGYFPVNPKEDPLYRADPIRGYTLSPGAHSDYITPEIDVDIDINADGIRDELLAEARTAEFRVLAVGDSFTMGLGVSREDTWSEQLERLMRSGKHARGVAVVNGGVPGYSPRQIRQRLAELLPRVQPHVVVFGFVTETFARMSRPVQLFGGTLVRSDAIPRMRATRNGILYSPYERAWMREVDFWLNQHWQFSAHVLARIYRLTHDEELSDWEQLGLDPETVRHHMEPTFEELTRSRQLAAQSGATFLILLINLQDPGGFGPRQSVYNRLVLEFCRTQNVRCIDPLPRLERVAQGRPIFRTASDQHWTPPAHAIAAEALLQAIDSPSSP